MSAPVTDIGLIAVNSGQVLLVRHPGEADWRIPRAALDAPIGDGSGPDAEAELAAGERALIAAHALEVLDRAGAGFREVGGVGFAVVRLRIAARPETSGWETRLVRLAQLPKELGSPDRELLDALLAG